MLQTTKFIAGQETLKTQIKMNEKAIIKINVIYLRRGNQFIMFKIMVILD